MTVIGAPSPEWGDFIVTLIPDILELVLSAWEEMPSLDPDTHENPITKDLCRRMIQNKKNSELPFRISYQSVELEPIDGTDQGDMDIAFLPSQTSQENIYFCLECKRLHVTKNGKFSSLATEYVTEGMMRFVSGRYSAAVNHGGMLGFVLNSNTVQAVTNVGGVIQARHIDLGMASPGDMQFSSVRPADTNARETHHVRPHNNDPFHIHHIFVSGAGVAAA